MTISIRPLRSQDKAAWKLLWLDYLKFYESHVSEEVTESTWQRILNDSEDPCALGAVDEKGVLLGIVHYLFHRSCWTVGDSCYLQDLFVSPNHRGAGTGEAMIKEVHKEASKRGAAQVYWLTQHFNEKARKLYDRVGELTPFIKYKGASL